MLTAETYMTSALSIAADAAKSQLARVKEAASAVADSIGAGGKLWVFGTGHSHLLAEELYGRAGGLVDVHAILEPAMMLHEGLAKSSQLERLTGLAEVLLATHPVAAGDCVIVISNSGRNAVPVEFAQGAKDRGATVIALTSLNHSHSVTSRAPDGSLLFQVADIVIDNCGVHGDAVIPHEPYAVGPTSTMVGALLMQALSVEVIGLLVDRGIPVRTYESLNVGN